MAERFYSERNLKFLMYEVVDVESLSTIPYFQDHSRETYDLVLETAGRMAREKLRPTFQVMDRQPPRLEGGTIKVHPMVREFMRECGQGGWIGAAASYEHEGQQLPTLIRAATAFIWGAANFSAGAYPFLAGGAADLIETYGSEELKATYIPRMFSGEWQGTMALTEPQAGSSLTDLTTQATPTDQGYYLLRGQKIFISAGDHDGVDNIVHLLLARIEGAPAGVKGISLFVVPKFRPVGTGLESNDLVCTATFHKMGYRGCPITQLSLGENGDCRGWLVGEPHRGLSYMFQMMNEARIGVGMQASSIASAAYYASLEYARERPQGRPITAKDPTMPQVPIIRHADIRRLLLFQRAVVEGSISLLLYCSKLQDVVRRSQGPERDNQALLLDLLTPVAKTYPAEQGVLSVSAGLQILGGYGYCDEFPLEQHYRDIRIHPIHEGTTGIQGMDLLGRKVIMRGGQALKIFLDEVNSLIAAVNEDEVLAPMAQRLAAARQTVEEVTVHLTGRALAGRIEEFLADASLYLELFGLVVIGWQWLLQGQATRAGLNRALSPQEKLFYQGKLTTMKYFFLYELPKTLGLAARLRDDEVPTVGLDESLFED